MLQPDFQTMVTQALKLYRDGRTLELAATALAHTALVEAEFLAGEPITPLARGRAVEAVLRWAIRELQPSGAEPTPYTTDSQAVAPAWRSYKILHSFYCDHWTIERIAEELGLAATSIFNLRTKAIAALADLLQSTLTTPTLLAARRQTTIAQRYQQLPAAAQTIVRIAAFFGVPIPILMLSEIPLTDAFEAVQESITLVVQSSLGVYDSEEGTLYTPPAIRDYGMSLLRADERTRWHQHAAHYYEAHFNYMEAARHWQLAGDGEMAANLLIAHYTAIPKSIKGNELEELLATFQPTGLLPATWARLKLLEGQSAEARANLAKATLAYEAALHVDQVVIKADAHYRLAKILEYRNLDEALIHYERGIELLERTSADNSLLVKMYIHRSWIFIQDRQDFHRAEANLQRAKLLVDPANREDYSDLYNASGELFHREGKWDYAIEDRLRSWLAAKESNDLTRIVKIGYNLGRDYTEVHRFPQALLYLNQSRTLALENDMLDMAALCQEVTGICYFYQKDYVAAISSYAAAYTLFAQVQNQTALTNVCFNLAEAYAINGQRAEARRYYEEGLALAATLTQATADASSLLIVQRFAELKQDYPILLADPAQWNERQQRALAYVQAHGTISNREYRTLNDVQNKTAADELTALVAQQLLIKSGQGAATVYRLPQPSAQLPTAALPADLTQRQRQAITYVQTHGQISNRIYRALAQVGNKAAATDLQGLVERGLLIQSGKGPATIYRLAT